MDKPARIAFRGMVFGCVLLDASASGAKVALPDPLDVPDVVTLTLPDGESRRMRCRWQVGSLIGLEAVNAANPAHG